MVLQIGVEKRRNRREGFGKGEECEGTDDTRKTTENSRVRISRVTETKPKSCGRGYSSQKLYKNPVCTREAV